MKSTLRFLSLSVVIAGAALGQAQIAPVSFHSGNGTGSQDSQVYTLRGAETGGFAPLTPGDFNPTLSGENAYIFGTPANYNVLAGGWLPNGGLSSGSQAKWVGVDDYGAYGSTSHSAIYAISFNLAVTAAATLNFTFTADDGLGDVNNEGLFIDGHAISNTRSQFVDWNGVIEHFSNLELGVLSAGQHTLYMNLNNGGAGPSGIQFEGTVTQTQAVPEPATMAILGLGALGVLKRRRKA